MNTDVEDVKFVINFDYPNNSEEYIHRIGRTGRSNNTGTAYTLFTIQNASKASDLINVLKEANQVVNPRLLDMVKKGGNLSNRNKYNQRGRPNGGGMNDFRNRMQQTNGQRPTNGSFGNSNGQRPTSRFSGAPNGQSSYQPRPFNGVNGSANPASAFGQRPNTTSHLPKTGASYGYDASNGQSRTSAEPSKFNGFQSKPPTSAIQNVYGQQSHQQSYPSVMTSSIPSMYNLPPPSLPYNQVQSVPYNYPPPVLPVKN